MFMSPSASQNAIQDLQDGPKSGYPYFCLQLRQMLTDFHNSFIGRLASKFATKSSLNISPNLTSVATLSCETLVSENRDNLKHAVINVNHKVV